MAANFSLFFVPELLTQLFHTPVYCELTARQQLRYNQLYAAHINEQFSYFERHVGNPISAALLPVLTRLGHTALAERVGELIDDEVRHQVQFDKLNRRVFPEFYGDVENHFIRPSLVARWLMSWITRFPGRLPFLLWLALFFEEFSVHLSRTVLAAVENGTQLEPCFVEIHRGHLRDEEGHVRLYPDLIRAVVAVLSSRQRGLQGGLLKRVMREVLAPKRSGIAVLRQLVSEFPELQDRERTLTAAVRGLKDSPDFFQALFGPRSLPVTYGLFEEFPEFSWQGYRD